MKIAVVCVIGVAGLFGVGMLISFVCALLDEESKTRFLLERFILQIVIGLLVTGIPILLVAALLRPQAEDIMPAFFLTETFDEIVLDENGDPAYENLSDAIALLTHKLSETPDESDYYARSWLYFYSGNYDLACADLLECYERNQRWDYAYNIGVCYSYMLKYDAAIEYLDISLQLSPPISERGAILSNLQMIESYYYGWFYSIIGVG